MKHIIILALFFYSLSLSQTPTARTWYYNQNGLKTNVKEKWSEDNSGLKHGTYIKYFENGEREILGNYSHNKPNGSWIITSDRLSKITAYANFKDGSLNGLYKVQQGDLILDQGNYTNGAKTGYWKENYNSDEKVYSEGNYINGKREGDWKNTNAIALSKQEIENIRSFRFENNTSNKFNEIENVGTKTLKGYKTVFKDNNIVAVYNEKGENLESIKLKADLDKSNKSMEEEAELFLSTCTDIQDYEEFQTRFPKSNNVDYAKQQIEKLKLEDNYLNPLVTNWKTLPLHQKNETYFDEYFNKFPNGYRKVEITKLMKPIKEISQVKGRGCRLSKSFNTDSYILTQKTQKELLKTVDTLKALILSNTASEVYIITTTAQGQEEENGKKSKDEILRDSKLAILSANRAKIVSDFLRYYLGSEFVKSVKFYEYPVAYKMEIGKNIFLRFEGSEFTEKARQYFNDLSTEHKFPNNEYGLYTDKLLENKVLKSSILNNIESNIKYNSLKTWIPLELYYNTDQCFGLDKNVEEKDKFKSEVEALINKLNSKYNRSYKIEDFVYEAE